jgi:hypothetical protein
MVDDLDQMLQKLIDDFDVEWSRFIRDEWHKLTSETGEMVNTLLTNDPMKTE